MHTPTATLERLRAEVRSLSAKEAVEGLVAAFERNDLLTYAHAIAFKTLFSLVPLALFAVGLAGFLGLEELWTREVVPELHESTSGPAFLLIDDTAQRVLTERQGFWITAGALITVWAMSGAARSIMGVFDRIYGCRRERSHKERIATSVWLATVTGALLLAAFALFTFGPVLADWIAFARWPVVAAMLFAAIALLVHFAPADGQPIAWVTFGAALVVAAWLGTSVAFAVYVRDIADYGSIYGALATAIVMLTYLDLAAIAFLTGAQLDALVRQRLAEQEGQRSRQPAERAVARA